MPSLCPFGQKLRSFRRRRGLSQLELAAGAGTTPRHVSFIETGRSRPGRALVLRIGACLDLPMRDRNALLSAAGLSPAFAEQDLDDEEMRPFRMAVGAILSRHEPYPACALDGLGRVRMMNDAARRCFPGAEDRTPEEALDAFLAPGPGRGFVDNFAEVAWAAVDRLRHQALQTNDPRLQALLERALGHLKDVERVAPSGGSPVMITRLRIGARLIRTFTAVMRFETAQEINIGELRVELVFPLDDEAAAFFRAMAEPRDPPERPR